MYEEEYEQSEVNVINDLQKLQTITTLNFDYFSWLLFYCRCIRENDTANISGMTLSRHELQCIGVDCEILLSMLISGDMKNLWVKVAHKFDYIADDGKEHSAKPGEYCSAMTLIRLHLKPAMGAFPYISMIGFLYQVCRKCDCNYREFLPPHYGVPCEDPYRFTQTLMNGECDPQHAARELDIWRVRVNERVLILRGKDENVTRTVSSVSERLLLDLLSTDHVNSLSASDPRIQREVSRGMIAKIIHRSRRTIRKWEYNGVAPRGINWPQPRRITCINVRYFLPNYLPAIKQLVPRIRDRNFDYQLREEILEHKYAC